MKRLLSIVALAGILLQVFSASLIVLDFTVHQKYIAATLCINKDKPKMHCNGHCHLKKQLDQQEKREQSTPTGGSKGANELIYFYEPMNATFFSSDKNDVQNFYFPQSTPVDFATSVFHPPSV